MLRIALYIIMLNVVMLNVVMLSVVMLSVVAPSSLSHQVQKSYKNYAFPHTLTNRTLPIRHQMQGNNCLKLPQMSN